MAAIGGRRSEEAQEESACYLLRCFCCWRKYCTRRIPRVAPGRDYVCMPADADDRPKWSVLVGCTSIKVPFHNLRLHRFRVAASGRVIGHSNYMLEPLLTVAPDDEENTYISNATVALAPNGRQLYGFCTHSPGVDGAISDGLPSAHTDLQFPLRTFCVDLDTKILSPLPPLPFRQAAYTTFSARGEIWAPSVQACGCITRLVMHQLVIQMVGYDWTEVASVDIEYDPLVNSHLSGSHLQGYAVINDQFILLSLVDSTFFCCDCAVGTLTPVTTVGKFSSYTPISGKAVHFGGDDDTVYFLQCAKLFAYKFSPEEGKLLAPPMEVERLWPYYEEGYGSVVHLTGRMMCAVWINMNLPCGCAEHHALITTFTIKGGHGDHGCSVPSGIEVLHSTCRRIDMLRSTAVPRYDSFDYFVFLQEYLDHTAKEDLSVPSSVMGGFSYTQVEEESPDDMPNCCRKFLSRGFPRLKECRSTTKPNFYFICQVNNSSLLYHISTTGGKLTYHEKLLEPHLALDTNTRGECGVDDPLWYFVHQGSRLYVIPLIPVDSCYVVDVSSKL